MNFKRHTFAAVFLVFLNACGGGGGGGGASTASDPTISGIAATGAAINGGTVTARCVSGSDISTTTATDGSFSLNLGTNTLPCMLKVVSGATELYSFVTGYGRINLTPLTDLALARAGGNAPATLFTGFGSSTASTINANLATAKSYVSTQVGKLDFNPVTIDILTGTFAVGDAHDQILDQLKTALTNNSKTQAQLDSKASLNLDLTTELPIGDVVISEVASGYYADTPFWFEIANRGASPVNLNGFTVKTSNAVLNVSPYTMTGSNSFALPSVTLAAGAYLVVSGQTATAKSNTSQVVFINDSVTTNKVPAWTSSGSIELIKDGQTRSFIRFGSNTDQPTTGSTNYTAPALPYGATSYGNAIVRYGTSATSMSAANSWSSVAWTTPAGPNDVPAGAVDADGDGIPNSAKVNGGTFAGIDLYAMGVRAGQKNILIQVDYMSSADPGVTPQKQAFENVKAAFAAKGYTMIIDAGSLFGDALNTGYNWGKGGRSLTSTPCVQLDTAAGCGSSLYQIKAQYFDVRRTSIFHYAIFGTTQQTDGSGGSSGIAEIGGNDFLVTLGNWSLNTNTTANTNKLINYQAGTFMHELGHNLGLRHGGDENTNYKPNYFSVMNYLYQLNGLSSSATGIGPFQRWKCQKYSVCSFTESASTSNSMVLSYSSGTSANLNENALLESANIGRGADSGVYADWNNSGSMDGSAYAFDINMDGSYSSALHDYNDWANIVLPFARNYSGAYGARMIDASVPSSSIDPMSNDRQPYIVETLHAPMH